MSQGLYIFLEDFQVMAPSEGEQKRHRGDVDGAWCAAPPQRAGRARAGRHELRGRARGGRRRGRGGDWGSRGGGGGPPRRPGAGGPAARRLPRDDRREPVQAQRRPGRHAKGHAQAEGEDVRGCARRAVLARAGAWDDGAGPRAPSAAPGERRLAPAALTRRCRGVRAAQRETATRNLVECTGHEGAPQVARRLGAGGVALARR